uniref:Anthranilate synthase, component II n=1 Tax=Candidatus Kentrum sp. UNK TaxID=2126344 RepID=A0A451A5B7_9GAMM|nr:MAG: anthranilate synthase, component II [Candidatus Kentron sp. UNK]VFK69794.1 MAG: anthranilate synthase, component II [Candidatus Kentron sp. UNK]
MLLMLDNYDSFTYNLVQYLGELGAEVCVRRNDAVTFEDIDALSPSHIVISPGPCTPSQAGISVNLIRHYGGKIPILGVCLGHQCIGQAYDGHIAHAGEIMHGKTSLIYHDNQGIFRNTRDPFEATRYHSLVVEKATLPKCLTITAWTRTESGELDEIMGLKHKELPVWGVQFHPESILSEHGFDILGNFLAGMDH